MGENKARSPLRAWTAAQHERDDTLICPFSNCKVLQKRQHAHLSSLKLQSTTKEMTISPVLSQTAEQHERDGTLICPFSNCKKLWTRQHTHLSFLKLQNSMNEMTHSITGPFSNCRTALMRWHTPSPVLSQTAEQHEWDDTLHHLSFLKLQNTMKESTLTCPFSNCRTLWKQQHTHLSFLKLQNTMKETAHSPVLSQTCSCWSWIGAGTACLCPQGPQRCWCTRWRRCQPTTSCPCKRPPCSAPLIDRNEPAV